MRTTKVPAVIASTVAVLLVGAVVLDKTLADRGEPSQEFATAAVSPEMVARLDKYGVHFTVDEEATEAEGEAAQAKVVAVAVQSLDFLDEKRVVYVSLGDVTVDDSPRLREEFRAWVVVLEGVEVPNFGGDPEERPVPSDFFVVVNAGTNDAEYAASMVDDA